MLRTILNYVTRNSGEDQFDVSMHSRSGKVGISIYRSLSLTYSIQSTASFPGDTREKVFRFQLFTEIRISNDSPLGQYSFPCCPLSQQFKILDKYLMFFSTFFISQPTNTSPLTDSMTISTAHSHSVFRLQNMRAPF